MPMIKKIFPPASKSQILLVMFFIFIISIIETPAQDIEKSEKKIRSVINAVLKDATFQFVDKTSGKKFNSTVNVPENVKLNPESAYNEWRYWNGVLNMAMITLAEDLSEQRCKEFAQKNVSFAFDNYKYFEKKYNNEGKWNYPFGQRFITEELDDCGAIGASVIEVFKFDQQERYKEYIHMAADHILNKQTRLDDKTFVRSFPFKWTLWADDLYMGLSFLSRMGEYTGDKKFFDDAADQVINFHKYLFDENIGLMHHCWYSDVNKTNAAFWGRANGWALVAQVDLLDRIPKSHPKREILVKLIQNHILGIARYQGEQGLWHQILDKTDSYLETSCSAMFTYTIARAVNNGYIEKRYASIALRGWEGVMSKIRDDGKVEGVCTGTVTSDDLVYYYKRPAPLNDVHGIGTILMAGAEVLKLISNL